MNFSTVFFFFCVNLGFVLCAFGLSWILFNKNRETALEFTAGFFALLLISSAVEAFLTQTNEISSEPGS